MDDLDNAIHADLTNATKFANSGGIAPEKTASVCTWTQPDRDALVRRFPTDYRVHLYRGLYYGFFVFFDHDVLNVAVENLRKASETKPDLALPHFYIAELRARAFPFGGATLPEARQREDFNRDQLNELNA
jgi:hypothetical protein